MDDFKEYYRIADWIFQDLAGTITPEERNRLEAWLQEDVQHPEIYARIVQRVERGEKLRSWRYEPSVKADWEKVRSELRARKSLKISLRPLYRYAAVIVLLVGVAMVLFRLKEEQTEPQLVNTNLAEVIKSGTSRAVLTLASGEKVVLEETATDSIQADGTLIEKKEGGLSYQSVESTHVQEKEVYNVLSIPNGGEYKLTLSDGTQVWVNSASELKYPVKFIGDSRVVYIKGEAYFEVSENPGKPFIVKTTHNMEIKVLGTHFNVSAYEEDPVIATTLAQGKVVVSDGRQSVGLVPNQQALFEKNSESFTRRNVDAYQYLSWKDGKFIFEEETLENIMERLSRWYDIQVFFKGNAIRNLRFSGDLEKYEDFSTAIRMLEKVSRIQVEIKKNVIFIGER